MNNDITSPPSDEGTKSNLMLGGLFVVIALLAVAALVIVRSGAEETAQTANVDNATPSAGTVTIATSSQGASASSIALTENDTRTVYIYGVASDDNGCEEIDDGENYDVVFYRSDVTGGADCTADGLNCYRLATPTAGLGNENACTGPADTDISYEFTADIQYYADATDAGSTPDHSSADWVARVVVTDEHEASSDPATATTTINTLTALSVTETVNYGSLALDGTSDEQTLVITNTGNNNALDYSVYDSTEGWTCDSGTFDADQVRYNTTAAQGYGSGSAMPSGSGSAVTIEANIEKASDEGVSSDDLYTTLQLPSSGISGSCSSTLTFTAL